MNTNSLSPSSGKITREFLQNVWKCMQERKVPGPYELWHKDKFYRIDEMGVFWESGEPVPAPPDIFKARQEREPTPLHKNIKLICERVTLQNYLSGEWCATETISSHYQVNKLSLVSLCQPHTSHSVWRHENLCI